MILFNPLDVPLKQVFKTASGFETVTIEPYRKVQLPIEQARHFRSIYPQLIVDEDAAPLEKKAVKTLSEVKEDLDSIEVTEAKVETKPLTTVEKMREYKMPDDEEEEQYDSGFTDEPTDEDESIEETFIDDPTKKK